MAFSGASVFEMRLASQRNRPTPSRPPLRIHRTTTRSVKSSEEGIRNAAKQRTVTKRRLIQTTLFGSLAIVMSSRSLLNKSEAAESENLTDELPSDIVQPEGFSDVDVDEASESGGDESSFPASESSREDVKKSIELTDAEVQRLMQEEEERRKQRNGRRGRLRELEETRAELAQKQLELLQTEQELLDREQSLAVLREELELERKIRALLTKEKEQAIEEAVLARGLCAGANLLP